MIDLDDFLIFAAINDAEREPESDSNDEWLNADTEGEPETFNWTQPVKHEEDNSERDWYRREREQIDYNFAIARADCNGEVVLNGGDINQRFSISRLPTISNLTGRAKEMTLPS